MERLSPALRHALRIGLVYAVAGGLWIVASDHAVAWLAPDRAWLTMIQTAKGWIFVALSGTLITLLVHRAVNGEALAAQAIARSEAEFRAIFDQAAVGIAHVDLKGRWVRVNRGMAEMLGSHDLVGHAFSEITHADDHAQDREVMEALLSGRVDTCTIEKRYRRADGTFLWILMSARLVSAEGRPSHFIVVAQDVDSRKKAELRLQEALAESEVLLGEIHHRVRNNLQVVITLLSLEAAKLDSPSLRAPLDDTLARIQAMGLIHEHLYQRSDFRFIALDEFVRDLCGALSAIHDRPAIALDFRLAPLRCGIGVAVPLAMSLVELVTNAFKHAFPDGRAGLVTIAVREAEGALELVVSDDGIGPPAGHRHGIGLRLVRVMTGGDAAMEPNPGGGTRVTVRLAIRD